MEKLIAKIQTQSTEMIEVCVRLIGGGHVSEEQRMVRAALIEVYGDREGLEAADTLMDEIGL